MGVADTLEHCVLILQLLFHSCIQDEKNWAAPAKARNRVWRAPGIGQTPLDKQSYIGPGGDKRRLCYVTRGRPAGAMYYPSGTDRKLGNLKLGELPHIPILPPSPREKRSK